jgi:hypothetical protein
MCGAAGGETSGAPLNNEPSSKTVVDNRGPNFDARSILLAF